MEQGVEGCGKVEIGGVVLVDVRAGGAHHTQIDVAPLLEDVGSFRIPDRCPPDRAHEHLLVERSSDP